ncbi:hypothetical protein QJS66_17500 [Kocuria rhizophila]|nr:hypothetical protein QJS66_17500 [Kocuria rhizophila]
MPRDPPPCRTRFDPIRFENAEADAEISCSLLDTLAATLVTSRWQRDLTDSSSSATSAWPSGIRCWPCPAWVKGLDRLDVAEATLAGGLVQDQNWEVLGEAVQTAMRAEAVAGREGMEQPLRAAQGPDPRSPCGRPAHAEFIGELGLSRGDRPAPSAP